MNFYSRMRKANVVPVYEKGDYERVKNYRSVSVLQCLAKYLKNSFIMLCLNNS